MLSSTLALGTQRGTPHVSCPARAPNTCHPVCAMSAEGWEEGQGTHMWGEEVGGNSGAGSQRMKSMSAGAKKEGGQIRQKEQLEQRHGSGEAAGVFWQVD